MPNRLKSIFYLDDNSVTKSLLKKSGLLWRKRGIMTAISILSLAAAMFVLAATPGPGVFATVSRSLASGFVPALFVILGIVSGDLLFLLFAIFGMSMIAHAMGSFFFLVKIAGGAYLIWLGVKIWRSQPVTPDRETHPRMRSGNYMAGLFITLSNPKVIVFYCTFLPTFMDLKALTYLDMAIVAAVVSLVLASVLIVYAYLADRAGKLLSGQRALKRMNRAAGGVMVATGVVIATRS